MFKQYVAPVLVIALLAGICLCGLSSCNNALGVALPVLTVELAEIPNGFAVKQDGNGPGMLLLKNRVLPLSLTTGEALTLGAGNGEFLGVDMVDDLYGSIDPATGKIRDIIGYGPNLTDAGSPVGMAYDPITNSVYVIDFFPLGLKNALHRINVATFERTTIGTPGLGAEFAGAYCLARHPVTGMLYAITVEDLLWRIDPNAATATAVGPLGFSNIQGISFSPAGVLYGIQNVQPTDLVQINTDTGAGTKVADIPLTYAFSSLAFKPDGTLWSVEQVRNALVQIDVGTGAILTEFDTLVVSKDFGGFYFENMFGLTYVPGGIPGGFVKSNLDTDAAAVLANGDVVVTAGSEVIRHYGSDLSYAASTTLGSLNDFYTIAYDARMNLIYVRDGSEGILYELDATTLETAREFVLHDPRNGFNRTVTPLMAVDSDGRQLFVRDEGVLYRVDLTAPVDEAVSEVAGIQDPQGVAVDPVNNVFIVNDLGSNPATLRVFDLDTLQQVAERGLGNQIHQYVVDPAGGRLAVNVRVTTSFDTQVFLLDTATLADLPFTAILTGENEPGSIDAQLSIDSKNNQLIVTRAGNPSRVEFYDLP
jgi:DNA-binding beta-propeller fold protein YncE